MLTGVFDARFHIFNRLIHALDGFFSVAAFVGNRGIQGVSRFLQAQQS
jgi:hypothetical protein